MRKFESQRKAIHEDVADGVKDLERKNGQPTKGVREMVDYIDALHQKNILKNYLLQHILDMTNREIGIE